MGSFRRFQCFSHLVLGREGLGHDVVRLGQVSVRRDDFLQELQRAANASLPDQVFCKYELQRLAAHSGTITKR